MERSTIDKLLFDRFIRVINVASVIDSLPEPLVMQAKEELGRSVPMELAVNGPVEGERVGAVRVA